MPSGSTLPAGASVLDANGKLVTLVSDGGEIFLTNDPTGESFVVHLPDGGACVLEFSLPKVPDTDDYYETVKATCRPGELDRNKFAISRLTGE